jgi:hypothetical protein
MTRSYCWNTLLQEYEPRALLANIVATMTPGHIIATKTLNFIAAFHSIVPLVFPSVALLIFIACDVV